MDTSCASIQIYNKFRKLPSDEERNRILKISNISEKYIEYFSSYKI